MAAGLLGKHIRSVWRILDVMDRNQYSSLEPDIPPSGHKRLNPKSIVSLGLFILFCTGAYLAIFQPFTEVPTHMLQEITSREGAITDAGSDITFIEANGIFSKMIEQSLRTTSMTEQRTVHDDAGIERQKVILTYDFADMKSPRLFTVSTTDLSDTAKLTYHLISVPEGVYASYKEIGPVPADKLGHWFPLSENGQETPEAAELMPHHDPQTYAKSYLGFYIPGNFTPEAQRSIRDYILNQRLYYYSEEDIRSVRKGDQDYLVYEIVLSLYKLKQFNELVADHLNTEVGPETLKGNDQIQTMEFWVNTDTYRLDQVDLHMTNGFTQTIWYYEYNEPVSIEKPMPLAPASAVLRMIKSEL